MANLLDLSYITGHKSISDMTDSEILEHLKLIRVRRIEKERVGKKPNTSKSAGRVIAKLNNEQIIEILATYKNEGRVNDD